MKSARREIIYKNSGRGSAEEVRLEVDNFTVMWYIGVEVKS